MSTNTNENNANYSKMIKEKNKSCLITIVYHDEFEKETFSDNTKSDENDNSDEIINDEKSMNNSYISNDDDNNENSSLDQFCMSIALLVKSSRENIEDIDQLNFQIQHELKQAQSSKSSSNDI